MAEQLDLVPKKQHTHAELCAIAVKWLKRMPSANGPGCQIAVSECATGWTGEIPDAIGFVAAYSDAISVVVEAKTSRSDFLADRKKPHRAPGMGVGVYRYMMCPEGIIRPDEVPEGWGLLWVNKRGHIKPMVGPASKTRGRYDDYQASLDEFKNPRDLVREMWLLIKLLARTGDPETVSRYLREANGARAIIAKRCDEQTETISALRRENYLMGRRIKELEPETTQ